MHAMVDSKRERERAIGGSRCACERVCRIRTRTHAHTHTQRKRCVEGSVLPYVSHSSHQFIKSTTRKQPPGSRDHHRHLKVTTLDFDRDLGTTTQPSQLGHWPRSVVAQGAWRRDHRGCCSKRRELFLAATCTARLRGPKYQRHKLPN